MIFIDTNVFYNFLFETRFSASARRFIESHDDLATSSNVINELISVSVKNLCEKKYKTRNYSSFRRFIANNGYEPFKKEVNEIFQFLEKSDLCILPMDENANHWRRIMEEYRLLPCNSIIVSTCILNGVEQIATFDRDFLRVDRLKIINLNI